jgi:hypothetical protein
VNSDGPPRLEDGVAGLIVYATEDGYRVQGFSRGDVPIEEVVASMHAAADELLAEPTRNNLRVIQGGPDSVA